MRRFLVILAFLGSSALFAQDTFFNFALGGDFMVTRAQSGYDSARFRMELELGEKNYGFVLQPAFGNDVTSLFLGPRLMLPFQIGSRPLFIIPDFTIGVDFGFGNDTIGMALDLKFGFRVFYEFTQGFALSVRPFGLALRPFNVWFGNTPNQTHISVAYEINAGIVYFF
ncbi:MAG: hypothetical protein V1647_04710 [Pseudomonadota bacterium]